MTSRMLLINGWATLPAIWDSTVAHLHRAPVELIDWRHCLAREGQSTLIDILESSPEPSVLIGWSIGATLALEAALENPPAVKALFLISGTARMTADEIYPGVDPIVLSAMRRELLRDRTAVLDAFFKSALQPATDPDTAGTLSQQAKTIETGALAAGLEYLRATDLRSALPSLAVPTLVIHATDDAIIPCDSGACLARTLPGARFETVEKAGHALPLSHPGRIATLIKEFLGGLPD